MTLIDLVFYNAGIHHEHAVQLAACAGLVVLFTEDSLVAHHINVPISEMEDTDI